MANQFGWANAKSGGKPEVTYGWSPTCDSFIKSIYMMISVEMRVTDLGL